MIGTLLLNRYELLEKIGEGGMGVVYKAECHLLNRLVAVKILKAEFSNNEDFVARFKREANSVACLSHPNIVNVYDVGVENNINFIVMEYIIGKTLKQLIKENIRLDTEMTLDIACQIAKALECAHKNNIIHRDIKPDNIMITDIYSLGVVMYEMVTGQVPYNADSAISVAIMHIQQPVIPPKEIFTDIPENINQAILKALEKEPINRYQTAKEMEEILNAINEDHNFKVNLNNKSMGATKVMGPVMVSDTGNGSKMVISKATVPKKPIKKIRQILSGNNSPSKNKKIMIIIGLIILVMIIGVLGKYLSKGPSTDIKAIIPQITVPKENVKLPTVEKKFVPSLIGSTQDIAKQTIVSNGFLLGNISNEYSDSISKGLVISQSPVVNTSYETDGKIDIVLSQGQKIAQVTTSQSNGKNRGKKGVKNK